MPLRAGGVLNVIERGISVTVTGAVLMLRLIDSLLTTYGSDTRITNMVDEMEIWINPLANPDGTYNGGNHTVSGATRGNANGYDLNRNFPDPEDGPTPGGTRQIETTHMMNIATAHNFVLSMNFHGGAECSFCLWLDQRGAPQSGDGVARWSGARCV